MALCVIVLLIYFAFFLYGKCLLTQDTYILAFRATVQGSEEWEDNPAGFVADRAGDVLSNKYFGNRMPRVTTTRAGKTVIVTGRSEARHSAMGRYFLKPKEGWDYEVSSRATKRENPKHIRTLKRLKDLGKEITDGN